MDFTEILTAARDNKKNAQKEVKKSAPALKTDFKTPAKMEKKKKRGVESAAVRAFLEKQAEEEKQKAIEEKKKKIALMKARAEANHMTKAHAMASRTKDNPKVFGLDQPSSNNNHVASAPSTTAADDDDDEVKLMFSKNKRRVAHKPAQKILESRKTVVQPEVAAVVHRPKDRLLKSDSDSDGEMDLSKPLVSLLPQKPKTSYKELYSKKGKDDGKRSEKSSKSHKDSSEKHSSKHHKKSKHKHRSKSEQVRKELEDAKRKEKEERRKQEELEHKKAEMEKKKKERIKMMKQRRQNAPPPMSFTQIMAMAAGNDGKPEETQDKPVSKPPAKKDETRPMTQEEKDRNARRQSKEYQRWLKVGGKFPGGDQETESSTNRAKPTDSKAKEMEKNYKNMNSDLPQTDLKTKSSVSDSKVVSGQRDNVQNGHGRPPVRLKDEVPNRERQQFSDRREIAQSKSQKLPESKSQKGKIPMQKEQITRASNEVPKNGMRNGQTTVGSKSSRPTEQDSKPMNPWDRIYGQMKKAPPKPVKRHIESDDEDDDEEYDSEMDSFIEDDEDDMDDFIDDEDAGDYSQHIKSIFGYDKSKYRHEREDDLRDMDTNFSQIMKEEAYSAKMGLKEDLEDIRREEEENRQKLLRKKAKKMRR